MRFDDQVAVITSAGGGLGEEYALLLASRGARVLVNDIGGPERVPTPTPRPTRSRRSANTPVRPSPTPAT
jgi:NAD(P)-dependent dehydrogenase (short-subunit alcohol dehydrogenase family)